MSKLVAILNVTPDSFSDGGTLAREAVLAKAHTLIDAGADVLDVGAESTRPDALALSPDEEWARLAPVWPDLAALCRARNIPLSLDTRHAQTAARALAIGCDWVNDVTGFRDAAMVEAVKDADCKLVAMHSLSVPVQKGEAVAADDIITFMRGWMHDRARQLASAGIVKERLIFDVGIGFGKNIKQNWQLLACLSQYKYDVPVLIGHSRKSLFAAVSDVPAAQRDDVTRAVSAMLALAGADYLRVHDVAGHAQVLSALRGA